MGQTILIVEDDKDLRENICSILQNEGFQTTEAVFLFHQFVDIHF